MKQSFFVFLLVMFSVASYSQEKSKLEGNAAYSTNVINAHPEFPGGSNGFSEFISKNYKAPNIKGLKGKVFVEFVVEVDGSLVDIKVIRDLGYGTGEEAIRVLKESPLWTPGIYDGKLIRVRYSLPITIDVK